MNVYVCGIDIVKQYKVCYPCYFHYQQLCYPCHFIFSSELDMSVLSTLFEFGHLASIPLIFGKSAFMKEMFHKKIIRF